ncbi:hypothetical protein GIB67_001420 [Kingdonia uniflora]|uniref:Uncharacterized protein n=1 Tax=Kingdonia uniflora TaxID=39325 RepID=A0A7J7LZ52_9MAGN|nr:hypothetical protein GIB67_001420 [Kingdonia uniflora]
MVHFDHEVTLWDCTCPLFVMIGLLVRMLTNVNLLVRLVHLLLIKPVLECSFKSYSHGDVGPEWRCIKVCYYQIAFFIIYFAITFRV